MSEEEIKISVPLYTNQELIELGALIENNYESIYEEISKTLVKDTDTIILKKVIEKQQKEIKESENYMKDKIREKIKDLEDNMILFTNDKEKFNRYKYARNILEKLLEEK